MKTVRKVVPVVLIMLLAVVLLAGCDSIPTCKTGGFWSWKTKTTAFEGQSHPEQPAYVCGSDGKFHPVEAKAVEVVPTRKPEVTKIIPAGVVLEATVLNGIPKGETMNIPAGRAVMGDVVATWPGFSEVMAAYDNGGSGEGTILWVSNGTAASVHAAWGAGEEICTSREDALLLVEQELRQGCGEDDSGGCNSVRLVTLAENGTSVEFFRDDQ